MLDSSPRIPCSKPEREARLLEPERQARLLEPARIFEWAEATFTRPMRSPFAESEPVEVALEESALFEDTVRFKPPQSLLEALSKERDSRTLRAAARVDDRVNDLAKTIESPTFHEE
jgi:hypothetical protein